MQFQKNIHYSPDLEAAVIGACLLEKQAYGRTVGIIDQDVFYYEANKTVYKTISEMYNIGAPIDIITVTLKLHEKGLSIIDHSQTSYYISQLTNSVVSTANLEYHSYLLKSMWMEREVAKLTNGGLHLEGDAMMKLVQLQAEISKIRSGEFVKEWYDMSELMVDLIKHQEAIQRGDEVFIKTGITELDNRNGGFYAGQVIVIGARPSAGKSAFMGQLAMNMARQGKSVGIISLEMSNNEIAGRLASIDSDIDFKKIYRGLFDDERQQQRFYDVIGKSTSELPIYISSKTKVNPVDIRAKADKLKHTKNLDCLFIDYLQLISADQSSNKTRENVVSEISRSCKIMAKELNIPVIELCQLSRASTHRQGDARYPQLSDLRESGAIEQDADVVMFIHRDWVTGISLDDNGDTTENKADILIRKWRNGESNLHIECGFDGPKMKFVFNQKNNFKQVSHVTNYYESNKDDEPF